MNLLSPEDMHNLVSRVTPDEEASAAQVRDREQLTRQLRDQWRRGWDGTTVSEISLGNRKKGPQTSADFDVLWATVGWAMSQELCSTDGSSVWLSPRAKAEFTITDQTLDTAQPDNGSLTSDTQGLNDTVTDALITDLTHALNLNPDRTVEYLLRARHQIPTDRARALTAELAAVGMITQAARILADLTPLTPRASSPENVDDVGEETVALLRSILGLG